MAVIETKFGIGDVVWHASTTTCIETINGDPDTAIRLSFQIKVF